MQIQQVLSPATATMTPSGTGNGIESPTIARGAMTSHLITAGVLGDAFASIVIWALQSFHIVFPASVSQAVTAVCMVLASYTMQRLGQ